MRSRWIDGAKGVAILMVVAVHVAQWTGGSPHWFLSMANFGAMGVQLFFVLSGYCALMSFDREKQDGFVGFCAKRYLLKRYKRLALPYFCAMILYCVLHSAGICACGINWRSPDLGAIIANVLLLNTFSQCGQNTLVPGGWSISCIAVFSLAFPWVERFTHRHFALNMILLACCGIVVSALLYYIFALPKDFCYMFFTTHIGSFAVGMAYYKWRRIRRIEDMLQDVPVVAGSLILIVFAATLVMSMQSAFLVRGVVVSFAFIGWLVMLERHAALIPWFLRELGHHSYAIFIFHFAIVISICPIVGRFFGWMHWAVRYALGYAAVIMFAWVASKVVVLVQFKGKVRRG